MTVNINSATTNKNIYNEINNIQQQNENFENYFYDCKNEGQVVDYSNILDEMQKEYEAQSSELKAAKKSGGLWDKTKNFFVGIFSENDTEKLAKKEEALNKALKTGNPDDIINAYCQLYADEIIDEKGTKISDLSYQELKNYLNFEAQESNDSRKILNNVQKGGYVANGKVITLDDLNAALSLSAQAIVEKLGSAIKNQGIISWAGSKINNVFGFGTSEKEAKAQMAQFEQMIEKLQNCSDINEFASYYKAITGEDFNENSLSSLLNYDSNDIQNCSNVLADNNAAKVTQSYIDTRQTVKDAIIGVGVGVGSVALAVATCGGSLAATVAIGAGISISANAVDSLYDSDGNGSIDLNYSFKEAAKDGALGALNAFSGGVANKLGGVVTAKIASKALESSILNTTSRLVGAAAEGALDGAIGSSGAYVIDCVGGDKEFSLKELGEHALMGAATGAVFNTGISATTMAVGAIAHGISAKNIPDADVINADVIDDSMATVKSEANTLDYNTQANALDYDAQANTLDYNTQADEINKIIKNPEGISEAKIHNGAPEINHNELCRTVGNDGNPLPKEYINNSADVRNHFYEAIDSGEYLANPEAYKNTINKAHELAYGGKSGDSTYYKKNGEILSKEAMAPGQIRSNDGRPKSGYGKKSIEVEDIARKYGDPYRANGEFEPVKLEGIAAKDLPFNDGRWHYYPEGNSLNSYYNQMYKTAKNTLDLIEKGATKDEILSQIALHYQYAANARPYNQINNSLFMNEVNTLLTKAGMPTMPQGILDHAAQRLQPENFIKYFKDFYRANCLQL